MFSVRKLAKWITWLLAGGLCAPLHANLLTAGYTWTIGAGCDVGPTQGGHYSGLTPSSPPTLTVTCIDGTTTVGGEMGAYTYNQFVGAFASTTSTYLAGGAGGSSSAAIEFYVAASPKDPGNSPSGVNTLPVLVSLSGGVNCSNSSFLAQTGGTASVDVSSLHFRANCGGSFTLNGGMLGFTVGQPYLVILGASIGVSAYGLASASGSALADPTFQIDPSFPYANDFVLEFSPNLATGVTQPSSIPEPRTLTVLPLGAAILLLVGRHRRKG